MATMPRRLNPGNIPCLPLLLVAMGALLCGCGTIPNVDAVLHTNPLYFVDPSFVGPEGPVTSGQARHIIARLRENQTTPSDILGRHLALEQALSGEPLVLDNQVILLDSAAATYQAMLAAIRAATDNINIQMFTFSDGPIGKMFADALIERQRHGVQVNLMYDSLGSLSTSSGFFDRMQQSGIAVLQYRPLNPFAARLPWSVGHRNHRKMLVVDGRIAFTGGINISEVYGSGLRSGGNPTSLTAWRDTDIQVEGPAVKQFQRLFLNEWYYQGGPQLAARIYYPRLEKRGNQIVRVIGTIPERFSLMYVTLISAILNSQTNIYITDAYFAPDGQLLHALEKASRRGVDVRLLLPSQSDEPMMVSAQRSDYSDLLDAGVRIYEWKGAMLHAKTATVDGVWSTVGTSNLDWWSIARDNELNAIMLSHPFGDAMNAMFMRDLEGATPIDPAQWQHRGLHERADETLAGLLRPML